MAEVHTIYFPLSFPVGNDGAKLGLKTVFDLNSNPNSRRNRQVWVLLNWLPEVAVG